MSAVHTADLKRYITSGHAEHIRLHRLPVLQDRTQKRYLAAQAGFHLVPEALL